MKKYFTILLIIYFVIGQNINVKSSPLQTLQISDTLPVRGFAIAAPRPSGVDSFITFIIEMVIQVLKWTLSHNLRLY